MIRINRDYAQSITLSAHNMILRHACQRQNSLRSKSSQHMDKNVGIQDTVRSLAASHMP